MIRLILISFLVGGCAHQDDWTRRDTVMQLGVTVVLVADAVTTSRMQYDPNVFEAGPIASKVLGLQPDTSDTYLYFGSLIVANYLISRALPAKWRRYWRGWEAGVHGYAVINNCNNGLC